MSEGGQVAQVETLFIFSDISTQLSHATTWWVIDYCDGVIHYALAPTRTQERKALPSVNREIMRRGTSASSKASFSRVTGLTLTSRA